MKKGSNKGSDESSTTQFYIYVKYTIFLFYRDDNYHNILYIKYSVSFIHLNTSVFSVTHQRKYA